MATETWVLNESVSGTNSNDWVVSFVSNGNSYGRLYYVYEPEDGYNRLVYATVSGSGTVAVFAKSPDYPVGWVEGEEYRSITFSEPVTDTTLLAWLQANGTKQSIPKVTVDLTSLSGYESLPAGTYALSVRAKASGYQDSDLSQTVSFTKLAAPVVTVADTTVTWDSITNAESYDVYVDGELYENTTGGGNV